MVACRSLIKALARRFHVYEFLRDMEIKYNFHRGAIHDAEYRHLPADLDGGLLVDAGANLGQSIVTLHALFPHSRILAFEPNPSCKPSLDYLALRMKEALTVHSAGLADIDGALTFHVPVLDDGTELLQEGSMDHASSIPRPPGSA